MKTFCIFYFVIFLFCVSCNRRDGNLNSQSKSNSQTIDNELKGIWKSDLSDELTKSSIGKVTMTFAEEGQLIYDIDAGDKRQIMYLVYRISGDTIISDQPSHPQERRTKFTIENKNKLALEFEGEIAVFYRAL
jgi:hypothetical protein